jgi:hypothetical protein
MIIGIDYDNTWTADIQLWNDFYWMAKKSGHQCIIVTGRKKWSEDMHRGILPQGIEIVYAPNQFKEHAALKAGYKVDIWIDDMPGMIQETKILTCKDEEL